MVDNGWVSKLAIARALENEIGMVVVNLTGNEGGVEFVGSSCVINNDAMKVAKCGRYERKLLVADVTLRDLRESRIGWNPFEERKTELYESTGVFH